MHVICFTAHWYSLMATASCVQKIAVIFIRSDESIPGKTILLHSTEENEKLKPLLSTALLTMTHRL